MSLEHVLVAGGGSGGHVFPALAVAGELVERGWQVSWLGRIEGMERQLVQREGLKYHGLGAEAVVGRSMSTRVAALATVGVSAVRAWRLIHRHEVSAVLGTGGYVSAPGVLGAALARRPVVLLEPNGVPGAANRWLSRFASVAAIGCASAKAGLRCPAEDTGVPVRPAFHGKRQTLDYDGSLRLLVLGGSQGARQLNELLPAVLSSLAAAHRGLHVTHQVGADLFDEAKRSYERVSLEGIGLSLVPFLEDVDREMAACHLIISRAGAITLAEICAVGRAALLMPLSLAGSHQVANAQELENSSGAVVLKPGEATADRLSAELAALLGDRQRLRAMGDGLYRLARPNAAADIADLVENVARRA